MASTLPMCGTFFPLNRRPHPHLLRHQTLSSVRIANNGFHPRIITSSRHRLHLISARVRGPLPSNARRGGSEEQRAWEESRPSRRAQQAALWTAEAAYIIWLFLLPYAPGDPVWAIKSETVKDLVGLSLNFFFVLPLSNSGSSGRTWKERKAIENQNVVAMGGKPQKKHRTPLSVALPAMKNKKKREHKQLEEDLILGHFTKRTSGGKKEWKRKPEDKVLRSSEGYFKKGVLDVKHLLRSDKPTKDNDVPHEKLSKGKNKRKGNKKGGKRRGR